MEIIKLTTYDNSLIGRYTPKQRVIVLADTTSGDFTVTLPDAFSTEGTEFVVINIGSNDLTIAAITGQYINNSTTITISQWETRSLTAFDGKYYITTVS